MFGCVVEIFFGQVLVWRGCIIGNSSWTSPVYGVVGPWSLLKVDPGQGTRCGPMLVTEPNLVGLLVTVLVVAIVFVTTTLAFDCLLCQILSCPHCI